jgi:hypothetical protein
VAGVALVVPYGGRPDESRCSGLQSSGVVGEPFSSAAPDRRVEGLHSHDTAMTTARQKTKDQEPLGIIISCGTRDEASPRVSAYIWGPVPEAITSPAESRAA